VVGQSVTLTASVAGDPPTGTVVFSDGNTTLASVVLDATGKTSYTIATLSVGTHVISASYGGDANNQASSAALTLVIGGVQVAAPTLDRWGVLLLGMLLIAAVGWRMARR